jgi:hypothetical protein
MWELARLVTLEVKDGRDVRAVLKLGAGTIRDASIDGILRRNRRLR